LFGEGPSTVILSAVPGVVGELRRIFEPLEIEIIGKVTAEPLFRISGVGGDYVISENVHHLRRLYEEALPGRLRH
jgi:hypothetical protein